MPPKKALPDSPLAALGAKPKAKRKTKARGKTRGPGRPPAETKKRNRTIYLPEDLDRELRVHAAGEGLTVSDVIADAVRAFLRSRSR